MGTKKAPLAERSYKRGRLLLFAIFALAVLVAAFAVFAILAALFGTVLAVLAAFFRCTFAIGAGAVLAWAFRSFLCGFGHGHHAEHIDGTACSTE